MVYTLASPPRNRCASVVTLKQSRVGLIRDDLWNKGSASLRAASEWLTSSARSSSISRSSSTSPPHLSLALLLKKPASCDGAWIFCVHWLVLSLSLGLHTFKKKKATQQSYCVAHTLTNTQTRTHIHKERVCSGLSGWVTLISQEITSADTYTHTPSLCWSSTFAARCQVCSSSANLSCLMCFLSSEAGDLFSRKAVQDAVLLSFLQMMLSHSPCRSSTSPQRPPFLALRGFARD